jgi:hypothetical protein
MGSGHFIQPAKRRTFSLLFLLGIAGTGLLLLLKGGLRNEEHPPRESSEQTKSQARRALPGATGTAVALTNVPESELGGAHAHELFDSRAAINPLEAAEWARNLADNDLRKSYMRLAAIRWINSNPQDPSALFSWASRLSADDRADVITAAGGELVRTDPLSALRLAADLPASQERDEWVGRAAAEWTVTDMAAAEEWVAGIEDDAFREQVTSQVVAAAAEKDPARAAGLALSALTPGPEQDRAVVSVVARWAQTDPQAAADWVASFPSEGTLRRDAAHSLVSLWVSRDPASAASWLNSLSDRNLAEELSAAFQSDP